MEEPNQEMSLDMSPPLQISDDSIKSANKRQRESSPEENTLPAKKPRNSIVEESPTSDKMISNLVTSDNESDMEKESIENVNMSKSQENISSSKHSSQNDLHHTEMQKETTDTLEKSILNENTHVNVMTSRTKGTEVVDGLELSVECASDKEESSSESDKDYYSKPRKKTIIIKAKSNESDDDDTDNDIENNDNEEDEIKHISSDKASTSGNESDNNNADKSKDKKKKKRDSLKPENNKRIQFLRKCLRTAGITARVYQESLRECKTNAAQIKYLRSLLEKHGVSGKPTLKKCQKIKLRNERLQEVSELDKSNIISEGRVTRSQSARDSKNTSSESRNTYKRIKIIDSDSE